MKESTLTIICVSFVSIVVLLVVFFNREPKTVNNNSEKKVSAKRLTPEQHVQDNSQSKDLSQDMIIRSHSRREHPVLEYQRYASYDTHPASYGDPIRPPQGLLGPRDFYLAYNDGGGPIVGQMLNVPVPQKTLKLASERYGYPFYPQPRPLPSYDYFKPYGPNDFRMQEEIIVADTPFYQRQQNLGTVPFISSVSSYAPFPEVQTAWEKAGIVETVNPSNDDIMNLYRRPIAPLQDLFEYTVQDKNGFVIPLRRINYLEDGDIIDYVTGKESLGPWKANIYVNNKWVWA